MSFGLIINHNLGSMNALSALNQNQNSLQKVLQQLSTGKRINGAADDAAGLAISQKMQGQINGLNQASRNAQDGISLIQTAEGALNETQSILQRMRQLAVQSASDTNTDADRLQIQKEVDQLSQELSRIGTTTQFNTQNLLDGTFKNAVFQIGANQDQNLSLTIGDMRGFALGVAGKVQISETGTVANAGNTLSAGTYTVHYDGTNYNLVNQSGATVAVSTDGKTYKSVSNSGDTITFNDAVTSGNVVVSDDGTGTLTPTGTVTVANQGLQAGTYNVVSDGGSGFLLKDLNGHVVATSLDGKKFTDPLDNTKTLFDESSLTNALAAGDTVYVGGIDVSTQSSANSAVTVIDNAIQTVSTERAKLGAYQNRLEHTINNLDASSQNLTTAESGITDTNMAQAMADFTRDNVLQQAAVSMLAQANQQPQLVLKLLG